VVLQPVQAGHELPALSPRHLQTKVNTFFYGYINRRHTKSISKRVKQRCIPRRSSRNTSRKSSNLLSIAHTLLITHQPRIFHGIPPSKTTYPSGPSCKHKSGNPIAATAATLPTQGPFCHPFPVTIPTLFAVESFGNAAFAFAYAAAQSPSPGAAWMEVARARREREESFIVG